MPLWQIKTSLSLSDLSRLRNARNLGELAQDVMRSLAVFEGVPVPQATPSAAIERLTAETLALLTSYRKLLTVRALSCERECARTQHVLVRQVPSALFVAYRRFATLASSPAFAPECLCRMPPVVRKLHACLQTAAKFFVTSRLCRDAHAHCQLLVHARSQLPPLQQRASEAFKRLKAQLQEKRRQRQMQPERRSSGYAPEPQGYSTQE